MTGKMDLRIEKTYRSLHNAFTELMEEKRFEEFTVNELCDRAMIRRATFYKHFGDKYEYCSFYFRETSEAFRAQIISDAETCDVTVYCLHMCRELLRFIRTHDRMVRNAVESSMFPTLLSILLEQMRGDLLQFLRTRNRDGRLTGMQMEGMAAFFAGGILSTLFRFVKMGTAIDEEAFVQTISEYLSKQ